MMVTKVVTPELMFRKGLISAYVSVAESSTFMRAGSGPPGIPSSDRILYFTFDEATGCFIPGRGEGWLPGVSSIAGSSL